MASVTSDGVDETNIENGSKSGETTMEMTLNGNRHGGILSPAAIEVSDYFARKVWPTRIVGAILLALASPLILLLVLAVRLTSRGPGLYRQARTGRHGKEFMMYKIRTMYFGAEQLSGPVWSLPGDSRITPLGKILRLLHFDELPQLSNVARGEMDLVGPRPERPCFVAWLADEIPEYRDRLLVLPGVTGLAQVNLPPDEKLECVRKKVVLDRDYICTANLGLDLRIVFCSFMRMIGIRHGRAVRWLWLERQIEGPENRETEVDELLDDWSLALTDPMGEESLNNFSDGVATIGVSDDHAKLNGELFEPRNGATIPRTWHGPK
jgi:lipopolysaccharide/colanic/teichoic acid biosynthesis glycosyltransferase